MKQNHNQFTLKEFLGSSISRSNALAAIRADSMTYQTFSSFPLEEQEKLISFIQGVQGLTITYDSFFKHIMNPDTHPSRLSDFLSAILGQTVNIHNVLPLEGVRMSESGSFVIMDLSVELSNKTIINVEIQKLGYLFPGERASCYLSDFVMRQYDRVKDQQKEHFSFRDLKPVILIVIMEKSSQDFKGRRDNAATQQVFRPPGFYDGFIIRTSISSHVVFFHFKRGWMELQPFIHFIWKRCFQFVLWHSCRIFLPVFLRTAPSK